MSRPFFRAGVAGLVAFAASALAQNSVPSASTTPPSTDDSVTTAPSTTSPSTPATTPVPPSTTSSPSAPPSASPPAAGDANARAATPREVGTIVQSEFPTRDANNDGGLDRAEFTSWLRELVARSPGGAEADAAGLDARIGTAFTQSDADGSGSISEAEMTALLSRRQ